MTKEQLIIAINKIDPMKFQPNVLQYMDNATLLKLYNTLTTKPEVKEVLPDEMDPGHFSVSDDKMPKITQDDKAGAWDPNALLNMLMPQGGSDYKKVMQSDPNIQTEEFSRLADMMNNKLYMDPTVATFGKGGLNIINKGDIKTPPKMETEDMRLQNILREGEATRRTWNSGMIQAMKEFDQDMELMKKYRDNINEIISHGNVARVINSEKNPEMKQVLKDLASASADARGLTRQVLEYVLAPILSNLK